MLKRVIAPVMSVFVVMSVSYMGYFGSRYLDGGIVQQWMAGFFGTTYFLSIGFGALYVYTATYVRGASLPQRITASLVNPLIWMTKEALRLTISHPLLESLYWYFNPLDIWLISFVIMEMGLGTLVGRSIQKRRDRSIRVVTAGPFAVIAGSLVFAVAVYAWGEGENIYVLFLKGYRFFFGYGL